MSQVGYDTIIPEEIYYNHLSEIDGVKFTPREVDIISCVLHGKSVKSIAQFFTGEEKSLHVKSVESHISNIRRKISGSCKDSIINFLEKSGKYKFVLKYYQALLIQREFKKTIYKIKELTSNSKIKFKLEENRDAETVDNLKITKNHLIEYLAKLSNSESSEVFSVSLIPSAYKTNGKNNKNLLYVVDDIEHIGDIEEKEYYPQVEGETKTDRIFIKSHKNFYFFFFEILNLVFFKNKAVDINQLKEISARFKDKFESIYETSHNSSVLSRSIDELEPKLTLTQILIILRKSKYFQYFIVILISILTFSIYQYFLEKNQLYSKIKSSTVSIEKTTTESFNYTSQLVRFMGSSIAEQKILNEEKIAEILSGKLFGNTVAKDLFSFTIFSWISSQKKIIISGLCGILREPKDISFRNYAKMADKEPWKLHLDHPDFGVPTARFILPAGMGIVNKDGSFLGIISMGFNLSNLNKEIKAAIKDDRIKYVIIFDDRTLVLQSDDGGKAPIIKSKNLIFENKISPSLLSHAIKSDKNTYIYYKKFNDYPLVVLVGYDHEALYLELYQKIFLRIIELLSIGGISIIMLSLIKRLIL